MKKKNKVITIIITTLVLIIIFLVGYILKNDIVKIANTEEKKSVYDVLSLNSREKSVIRDMQATTLKYGSIPDNRIYSIVAEEIATAFDLSVEPLQYNTVDSMLEDVSSELLDFTANIFPTEDNLEKFDFSVPIAEYKVFYFYDASKYKTFDIEQLISQNEEINLGYTEGFLYKDLLENKFNKVANIKLIEIDPLDNIQDKLLSDELDFFAGDTGFYGRLGTDARIAVTRTNYIEELFMHVVMRKDSNPYFMTAVNKLFEHEEFRYTLVRKINNYRSDIVEKSIKVRIAEKGELDNNNYNILVRDFKPYAYLNEDGEIVGAYVDILKGILDSNSVNYVMTFKPSEEISLLDTESMAKYDIIFPALKYTKEDELYSKSNEISKIDQVVIGQKNKPWAHYHSIHDLYSYRIGIVKDAFYRSYIDDVLYSNSNVFEYNSMEQLVNGIQRGEIDLGVVSDLAFNNFGYENTILDVVTYENITIEPMHFVYYFKDDKESTRYIQEFNMLLDNFDKESVLAKYVGAEFSIYDLYDEQTTIIRFLAVIITIVTFLLVVTLGIAILRVLYKSNYDALTKIRNRKTLRTNIEKFKFQKDMAIAYLDVRNLKSINDIYGDDIGDKALMYLAENLQTMSKDNKVFRVDGDEFLVIYNYRLFDFRDEIKNIFNVEYDIEGEKVKVGGSISIINLSKYGHYSFFDIINILNYTMRVAKGLGYIKSLDVDDDYIDEYFKMETLRQRIATDVEKGNISSVIIPIKYNNKLHGGILQPVFYIDGSSININALTAGKYNVLPSKLINDVSKLLFASLCNIINNLTLKGCDVQDMIHIHEENDRIITESDVTIWKEIMAKHKINSKNIFFKVNPDIFNGVRGLELAKVFKENELEIVFKYAEVRGEILAVVSSMNKFVVEIDTEVLQNIPQLVEDKNKDEIYKMFDNNLFIESQINFINTSQCDVLISYNETVLDEHLIEYYTERIKDKKIYYSVKYNEQHVYAYLERI